MMQIMLLSLLACRASLPLSSVPIEGGTEDQRAEVRTALLQAEAALGEGRVELSRVQLEPIRGLGRYGAMGRTMVLHPEQDQLGRTVWHELCHALASQEGLVAEPSAVLDAATELLLSSPSRTLTESGPIPHNPQERREEGLAEFCELGPIGAWSLRAHPCVEYAPGTGEPALQEDLGDWLLANVWWAFLPPEPLSVEDLPAVHVTGGSAQLSATADPSVIVDATGAHFDLYTGDPVESELPALPSADDQPGGLGHAYSISQRAGWAEGPSAVSGWWSLSPFDSQPFTAVASPEWQLVDDLCLDDRTLFTADDALWAAWRVSGQVSWVELGRRSDP